METDTMQSAAEPKTTKTQFDRIFANSRTQQNKLAAIAWALKEWADGLDKTLMGPVITLHQEVNGDLTPAELALGFNRAARLPSDFLPSPGKIRSLSGHIDHDPVEQESMDAFRGLLDQMRGPHGPTLRTLPGRLKMNDEQGNPITPVQQPPIAPTPLSARIRASVEIMGLGSIAAGLGYISTHPALRPQVYDVGAGTEPSFEARHGRDIERRWVEIYREVKL